MSAITKASVFKYFLLPAIFPRIKTLFGTGFICIPFFMAHVFAAARIFENTHPYLQPVNAGKFGVKHVLAEAMGRVRFRRENIDQVVIVALMFLGVVLALSQILMIAVAFFIEAAHAGGLNPAAAINRFLMMPPPRNDVAYVLLDRVFGVPGIFTRAGAGNTVEATCVAMNVPCFVTTAVPGTVGDGGIPSPFHVALHSMFQFYSFGLMLVALFILGYMIMVVWIETAEHGTPFGRRYNKMWAPVRLVMAFALLMPISNGLNMAQYIVLYAAKHGSAFATNGWTIFVQTTMGGANTIAGDIPRALIANPNAPSVNNFFAFSNILSSCIIAERTFNNREVRGYLIFPLEAGLQQRAELSTMTFAQAIARSRGRDLLYRFGVYEEKNSIPVHKEHAGGVRPVCGELFLRITEIDQAGSPGSRAILEGYHNMVRDMWASAYDGTGTLFAGQGPIYQGIEVTFYGVGSAMARNYMPRARLTAAAAETPSDPTAALPSGAFLARMRNHYLTTIAAIITNGVTIQATSTASLTSAAAAATLTERGWAGAGAWYNIIARLNGDLLGAAYNLPTVRLLPEAMEYVRRQKLAHDEEVDGLFAYAPWLADSQQVVFDPPSGWNIAYVLYQTQKLWTETYTENLSASGGNFALSFINALFGTEPLFSMVDNVDTHPLAQLATLGRSLVETSIRNIGYSGAATIGGVGLQVTLSQVLGSIGKGAGDFLMQVAFTTLTVGFVLHYVVPFMPFLYFFFAVGGWVKGIFEAMVGVPLWALAHLRIDGDNFSGPAARGGYYIILEIFLRPIMIIFGLIAAVSIFSAQIRVLNEIWSLVTSNITGFDVPAGLNATSGPAAGETGFVGYFKGAIDQIFYTIIYAIIVYLCAMASFKLIDLIPSHIMRWLGADSEVFNDKNSTSPENLTRNMAVGSGMIGGQLRQMGAQAKEGMGQSIKAGQEIVKG